MSGDGDGWVICAAGHRHWGRFGAAGLLISDGERAILQHRAPWTHEGGTWGLPGGARDSHEDPTTTALREAGEEAAIAPFSVAPVAMWVDDHGGWSYTTVLAQPTEALHPHAANAESTEIRWWDIPAVDALPLHHGFAATWPHLRTPPQPLLIVVDTRADASSTGSPGPSHIIWDELGSLTRSGVPVAALPRSIVAGRVSSLVPRIVLIAPEAAGDAGDGPAWWRPRRQLIESNVDSVGVFAAICRAVGDGETQRQVVVVSSDPDLAALVQRQLASATVVGRKWLFDLLEPAQRA